jgi:peptidoglycan L-alanyl-D-glutamate endopeptidase CwlK
MAVDERSEKNIKTLNPKVQVLARKLIETATAQGIHVKDIYRHRTYEEQNDLYTQGRTKPRPIVTKAKGGQSNHNFATAFDVGIFSADGKKYIDESNAYDEVGKIGESLGLTWGGSWSGFKDEPHFEFNEGRSMAKLRDAYDKHGDTLA